PQIRLFLRHQLYRSGAIDACPGRNSVYKLGWRRLVYIPCQRPSGIGLQRAQPYLGWGAAGGGQRVGDYLGITNTNAWPNGCRRSRLVGPCFTASRRGDVQFGRISAIRYLCSSLFVMAKRVLALKAELRPLFLCNFLPCRCLIQPVSLYW